MAKVTLDNISNFTSTTVTTINTNFDRLEAAIENTLSRDGTTPNQLTADLDINHQDLLNIGNLDVEDITVDGQTLEEIIVEIVQGIETTTVVLPTEADTFLRRNPADTAFLALTAAEVRSALGVVPYVETKAALAALIPSNDEIVHLIQSDIEGDFKWTLGDFSTQVANDPLEGLYIESDTIAATSGAWVRILEDDIVDPAFWGVSANGVILATGNITSGDNTLTCTAANFTIADIGKSIAVFRAGAVGSDTRPTSLITTIASINSSTSVELTAPAGTTAVNTRFAYGTDDSGAWQAALLTGKKIRSKPNRRYFIGEPLGTLSNSIEGQNSSFACAYADTLEVTGIESVFYINGASDVTIRDLKGFWFGNFISGGGLCFIRHSWGRRLYLDSVEAGYFPRAGIQTGASNLAPAQEPAFDGLIENCYFHHCRNAGLFIGDAEDLMVRASRFHFNGVGAVGAVPADGGTGYGIANLASTSPKNISIIGCHANDNFRKGIDFHTGVGIKIIGNFALRNKIFGIYAEDTAITGDVIITDNTVGEMTWNGTVSSGVAGEGSAGQMYGIMVGAQVGQGVSADPTNVIIARNIIQDFSSTSGTRPIAIYVYAGGWSFGRLQIKDNTVAAGVLTSLVTVGNNTVGTAGNYTDLDISGNILIASETTSVPVNLQLTNSRRKICNNNQIEVTTVGGTSGVINYGSTAVSDKSWQSRGNIIIAPSSAWSALNDAIRIFRTGDELVEGNTVNGAVMREWTGYNYVGRGTGVSPTTLAWFVGDEWIRNNTPAAGAPGAICITAGTPGTWKAKATIDA